MTYTLQQSFEQESIFRRGSTQGIVSVRVDRPGTLKEAHMWVGQFLGGRAYWGIRMNKSPLFALFDPDLSLSTVNPHQSKTGLTIPALFANVFSLDLTVVGSIRLVTPMTMILVIEES